MNKVFKKEVIIGVCVALAIAVLVVGIDYLKGINIFTPANYYYASYTDVQGLAQSAPVTINGFKVGLVRSIEYEYDNPGHVKVELSLDKQLKVPVGTKAVIASDILGTASVVLQMGTSSEYQKIGTELEGVTDAGMMASLTEKLMPSVSSILPKIDTLLTNINTLVADPAITASVKRLDGITAQLEATARNLNAMTSRLSPVLTDVQKVTGNVAELTGDLASVTGKLKDAPIDSLLADLEVTTTNLKQLSEQLNNPNSSLGKLMHDPALYNNINATVTSLDSLFVDIKRNPKRYVTIKVF